MALAKYKVELKANNKVQGFFSSSEGTGLLDKLDKQYLRVRDFVNLYDKHIEGLRNSWILSFTITILFFSGFLKFLINIPDVFVTFWQIIVGLVFILNIIFAVKSEYHRRKINKLWRDYQVNGQFIIMILEKEINNRITSKIRRSGFLVKQEVRFNPVEIDIIILDSTSLKLVGYEIKRSGWKNALKQAMRNKKYCHFSYAILPENERKNVVIEDFERNGIGLLYFRILKRGIKLFKETDPKLSDNVNRVWKKIIYSRFLYDISWDKNGKKLYKVRNTKQKNPFLKM